MKHHASVSPTMPTGILRSRKSPSSPAHVEEKPKAGMHFVRKPLPGAVNKRRQNHMDARVVELTEITFKQSVQSGLFLVEFSAPWCSVRKVHDFFFQEVPARYPITFRLCDVDKNPGLASKLGVFSLPTWILFNDGCEVDRFLGHDAKDNFLKCMKDHSQTQSDSGE